VTRDDIPETVTVDGQALDDAVHLLGLMEDFLLFHEEGGEALVRFYGWPTTVESLANFVGSTGAYLRRRLEGIPS
jgi:hypothetical protein